MLYKLLVAAAVIVTVLAVPFVAFGALMLTSYFSGSLHGSIPFAVAFAILAIVVPSIAVTGIWIAALYARDHPDATLQLIPNDLSALHTVVQGQKVAIPGRRWSAKRIPAVPKHTVGEVAMAVIVLFNVGVIISFASAQFAGMLTYISACVVLAVVVLILCIVYAIRSNRAGRHSFLTLDASPAPIGGTMSGHIDITIDVTRFREAKNISVQLLCLRETMSDGTPSYTVVWEQTNNLLPSDVGFAQTAVRLPLSFDIPADADASDTLRLSGRVIWRVDVHASLPYARYYAQFIVPVFADPDGRVTEGTATPRRITRPSFPILETSVQTRIEFPVFLFNLFGRSTVVATMHGIQVRKRQIVTSQTFIPRDDIVDVYPFIEGQGSGISGRISIYYGIYVGKSNGKRTNLGIVAGKADADYVCERIRQRLSITPSKDMSKSPDLARLLP